MPQEKKSKGKVSQKTTEWYQVLEESFEFEETTDQVKSINEITKDLKSKPLWIDSFVEM